MKIMNRMAIPMPAIMLIMVSISGCSWLTETDRQKGELHCQTRCEKCELVESSCGLKRDNQKSGEAKDTRLPGG